MNVNAQKYLTSACLTILLTIHIIKCFSMHKQQGQSSGGSETITDNATSDKNETVVSNDESQRPASSSVTNGDNGGSRARPSALPSSFTKPPIGLGPPSRTQPPSLRLQPDPGTSSRGGQKRKGQGSGGPFRAPTSLGIAQGLAGLLSNRNNPQRASLWLDMGRAGDGQQLPVQQEQQPLAERRAFFKNTGNTCYAGSLVTDLLMLPSLVKTLESHKDDHPLLAELHRLGGLMTQVTSDLTPFLRLVDNMRGGLAPWTAHRQQDPQELMSAILTTLARSGVECVEDLTKVVTIWLSSECLTCGQLNHPTREQVGLHSVVRLAIPPTRYNAPATSLSDCWQFMLDEETCMVHCDNCAGIKEQRQHLTVTDYPQAMIISLCRFTGAQTKDSRPVEIPLVWTPLGSSEPFYLRSATIHHGNDLKEGHFTTVVIDAEDGFYCIDNDRLEALTQSEAVALLSHAYMVTYDRLSPAAQASPIKKQLRVASLSSADPPAVDVCTRNLMSAFLAEDGEAAAATAAIGSMSTSSLLDANDNVGRVEEEEGGLGQCQQFIQSLVQGQSHQQFNRLDRAEVGQLLQLVGVPLDDDNDGASVKYLTQQLHSRLTELILDAFQGDEAKTVTLCHRLNIKPGKLGNRTANWPRQLVSRLKSAVTGLVRSTSSASSLMSVGSGNFGSSSSLDEIAATQPSTEEVQQLRRILAKERANQRLSSGEKGSRKQIIGQIVHSLDAQLLGQFLQDCCGGDDNIGKGRGVRATVISLVGGSAVALDQLLDLFESEASHLLQCLNLEIDQLVQRASINSMTVFLQGLKNRDHDNTAPRPQTGIVRLRKQVCLVYYYYFFYTFIIHIGG